MPRTFSPVRSHPYPPPRVPLDSAPTAFSDPLDAPPGPPLPPPAETGTRVLAIVGGLVALAVVMTATFGTAVLALFGIAVAWAIVRRKGRALTRGASWWGAALGVALGFAGFMAVTLVKAPPGTMAKISQSHDSIVAASPPRQPEWLQRIDPTGGRSTQLADSASERLIRSPAFLVWAGAMSTMLVSVLLGGVVGTLGWGVTMLLAFGVTGRWLPRRNEPAAAPT